MSGAVGHRGVLLHGSEILPARYWRIYITQRQGGGSGYSSMNEVQLRDAPGGPDLTTPTPTNRIAASSDWSGSNGALAFNNNTADTSAWVSGYGINVPHWVRYDFTAGNEKAIVEVAIWPESTEGYNRAPRDFEIQSSPDASAWTTVKAFSGITGWNAFGADGGGIYRVFSLL